MRGTEPNIGNGGVYNLFADVIRFFHEKEEKDHREGDKDTRPVEDPAPALIFGDETANHGREVVAACQEEGIQAHVCTSFVCKVLGLLATGYNSMILREELTTSVTLISGRASIGAVKKP
jgi:hypothetical protein